jgi:mono/diheme cytochrome c family protein
VSRFPALSALVVAVVAAARVGAQSPLPPPATAAVDFARDVKPLLQVACARCHARGNDKGGFRFDTRDLLLKGGDNGPAIVPGKSDESLLISLVAGLDPEMVMPQKGSRLTDAQIGLLRAWIDAGAPWPEGATFAKAPPRHLTPRRPPEPVATDANAVDRLLRPYFERNGIGPAPAADARFIRRVTLDVTGLLPSPDEVASFLADTSPGKRARLVDRLLGRDHQYAEHWMSFWNDLLRNEYRGTGYIDGGRKQISGWLYDALVRNLPYDQFVTALVDPTPPTVGFTGGIVWRGVVNASQTPEMQAAQNVSQVFMGVNLKCASCHDSFIDDWQLRDAYGLASVFAAAPLEMVECDKPTGRTAPLKFLYDGIGTIDRSAAREVRMRQLAAALVSPANGRLSRTIVNRLWARFMGRGLVEPLDDMEQASWHPDLLDWLAEDLVAHGYDLKHAMRTILTSDAYARAAVSLRESAEPTIFRGPAIRRMTAEQFSDAIGSVTGSWLPADAKFEMLPVPSHRPQSSGRAVLARADALTTALGRPNREQVVTRRAEAPTTLQALELANGGVLSDRLAQGGALILESGLRTSDAIARAVFTRGLGRQPTTEELRLARDLLGEAPSRSAVEDLLWSLVMLPEFQLIH